MLIDCFINSYGHENAKMIMLHQEFKKQAKKKASIIITLRKNSLSSSCIVNCFWILIDEMKSINEEFEPKKYQVPQGSNEKTEPKEPVFSTLLRG